MPNFRVNFHASPGDGLFEDEPGVQIEEATTFREPDFDYREETFKFQTESEAVQHIVRKMTEQIAQYQHIEEMVRKRKALRDRKAAP